MHKLLIIISAIIINLSACKAQEKNNETIDPVKPSPYKVLRDNPYVDLPDSLGGEKYKGFAFVEGQIADSTLKVIHVRIMKLKLQTTEGGTYIDYYYGIDSTNNAGDIKKMKQFLPFFEEYLNSLRIERVEGVKPENSNIITLPIKF
jgi:hypothetical protein